MDTNTYVQNSPEYKLVAIILDVAKKVREKSRVCHNHKPQPFPDPKRKRKPTNLNKHKPNSLGCTKKVREKSRECHNHKPQPFPDHKPVQTVSPEETPTRDFLKLDFTNKGLDVVNISNILNHKKVTSLIFMFSL